LTDPVIQQQRAVMDMTIKMQILSKMPPAIMSYYYQTGQLPPEVLLSLPPEIQVMFGGDNGQRTQGSPNSTGAPGGTGGGVVGVLGGLPNFGTSGDNRQIQSYENINDGGTLGTTNRTKPVGQVS